MRAPTKEELDQLADFVCERNYINPSEEERREERAGLEHQSICVFENYITDGPGYAGRVIVIVWGGAPEFTETFVFYKNKIEKVRIER